MADIVNLTDIKTARNSNNISQENDSILISKEDCISNLAKYTFESATRNGAVIKSLPSIKSSNIVITTSGECVILVNDINKISDIEYITISAVMLVLEKAKSTVREFGKNITIKTEMQYDAGLFSAEVDKDLYMLDTRNCSISLLIKSH